ncbi:metallophosphoesterase family protein [Alkalicoccus chagannorensis]|uniref:metallophosphoesterase family protein n=1 Tax=Alkalicoccus chagannorensis TaxID=427072 RepID=UPI0004251B34|nr:metallophosphoesterase family protein [Alkalicoccus chagannorensis]
MKTALLSDIHGNEQALHAVLEDASSAGVSDYICLGDIAFRGPKPKASLDLVRSVTDRVIVGNADLWTVRGIKDGEVPDAALEMMRVEQTFTASQLSSDDISYLHALPVHLDIPLTNKRRLFAFHAEPEDPFPPVRADAPSEAFESWFDAHPQAEFFAYGHIHTAHERHMAGRKIINTGSIGLPFDGDPAASYVIIHRTDSGIHTEHRRVQYNVDQAVQDLHDTGYPAQAVPLLEHVYRNGSLPTS